MTGADRIAAERQRQLEEEGYDAIHDEGAAEKLAMAGATYALSPAYRDMAHFGAPGMPTAPLTWPWDARFWKPSQELGTAGRIRELEKAGALIAAAIDDLARDL